MCAIFWVPARDLISPMHRTVSWKTVELHNLPTSFRAHAPRPHQLSALRRCSRPQGPFLNGGCQCRKIWEGSERAALAKRTYFVFKVLDQACGRVFYDEYSIACFDSCAYCNHYKSFPNGEYGEFKSTEGSRSNLSCSDGFGLSIPYTNHISTSYSSTNLLILIHVTRPVHLEYLY